MSVVINLVVPSFNITRSGPLIIASLETSPKSVFVANLLFPVILKGIHLPIRYAIAVKTTPDFPLVSVFFNASQNYNAVYINVKIFSGSTLRLKTKVETLTSRKGKVKVKFRWRVNNGKFNRLFFVCHSGTSWKF